VISSFFSDWQQRDLTDRAGLAVFLNVPDQTLVFGSDVMISTKPERRPAYELASVLQHPEAIDPEDILYTVYRGIATPEAAPEIARRGLTYVALVLRAGTIGDEWVRTRGHTNSHARSTLVALPEVHEVWHGRGLLYLQRTVEPDVDETVAIPLLPGRKVVVAPGWASLIANIGDEPLVLGSWRALDCQPHHEALIALGGMAHFIVDDEQSDQGYAFEPNPRYNSASEPRVIAPQDMVDFGLKSDEPMLMSFHRNPDFLRFMLRPQDYEQAWAALYKGDSV
jgi:oxalate decarboxylase/phosphoglucose isomerase-like protein (cupin superfamily)